MSSIPPHSEHGNIVKLIGGGNMSAQVGFDTLQQGCRRGRRLL
jgi:hypothetical protein